MNNDLDSDLLRTLVAITDSGSFTRAADIVHRTQSAVSMQMKRLEEISGSAIFEKDGRNIRLTRQGETLLHYARRILKLQDEALASLQQSDLSGQVRLGIPDDYVAASLPEFLKSFNHEFPLIEVNIECQESVVLYEQLQKGLLDIAVMTQHNHETLAGVTELRREQVVWVTSKDHIIHEHDPLPLVVFGHDCIFRRWATDALDKKNRQYRLAYSSPSLTGILAFVESGLGITVLSESSVTPQLRILSAHDGFPGLPTATLIMARAPGNTSPLIDHIQTHICQSFCSHQRMAA